MKFLYDPENEDYRILNDGWCSNGEIIDFLKDASGSVRQLGAHFISFMNCLDNLDQSFNYAGRNGNVRFSEFVSSLATYTTSDLDKKFIAWYVTNLKQTCAFFASLGIYGDDMVSSLTRIAANIETIKGSLGDTTAMTTALASCTETTEKLSGSIQRLDAALDGSSSKAEDLNVQLGNAKNNCAQVITAFDAVNGNVANVATSLENSLSIVQASYETLVEFGNILKASSDELFQTVQQQYQFEEAMRTLASQTQVYKDMLTNIKHLLEQTTDMIQSVDGQVNNLMTDVNTESESQLKVIASNRSLADDLRVMINQLSGDVRSSYQAMLEEALSTHDAVLQMVLDAEKLKEEQGSASNLAERLDVALGRISEYMLNAEQIAGIVASLKVSLPIVDAVCDHIKGSTVDMAWRNSVDTARLINEIQARKDAKERDF